MDSNDNKISDYAAVGLDKYMRPLNAPVTDPSTFVGGMDFNTNYDRNAVTAVNLRNFNFNAGTGGTIVLGGASNGNGNFIIKNAAGSTIVTGDNQGITVTGGNISVQNSVGTTILDATGLISTANFRSDGTSDFNNGTTTSTSYVDVPGGTLSPFTLTRNTKVQIAFDVYSRNVAFKTGGQVNTFTLNDGTAVLSILIASGIPNDLATQFAFASKSFLTTLGSGTHTLGMQYKTDAGGTARLAGFDINYVILGN